MKVLAFILFMVFSVPVWATTYYVRDGGSTYGNTSTTCSGLANNVYTTNGGSNCAVNNLAYLTGYNCNNYGGSCGIGGHLSSGDTVYIEGDSDINPGQQAVYKIGQGNSALSNCTSGSASECTLGNLPTNVSIIGRGTHKPLILATNSPWQAINANNSGITLQWLEIATHTTCGYISPTAQCSNGEGSNRTTDGIAMSGTGDTLIDVWVHGFSRYGIITASLSGTTTFTRVWLIGNSFAGFTLGNNDSSTNNGTIVWNQPIVEWSGCLENYPLTQGIDGPADHVDCYGQNSGGYGDGIAFGPSGNTNAGNWTVIGPGSISFNVQDGFDTLHGNGNGTIQIDKMRFEGNAGNQVKINAQTGIVTNSVIIGDCGWMDGSANAASGAMQPGDSCRAQGNTISYFTNAGSGTTDIFYNNTILGNGNVQFLQNGTCDSTDNLIIKNNIVYGGYWWNDDTTWNGSGGNERITYIYAAGTNGDGLGCSGQVITEDYNTVTGHNNSNAGCNGAHDKCGTSPGFTGSIPMGTSGGGLSTYYQGTQGVTLIPISTGSAAKGSGVSGLSYWNNENDYYNVTRPSPPSMGAEEPSSCAVSTFAPCFYNSDCCGDSCTNNSCGTCTPNCSGAVCGASDGCGGYCSSGSCTSPLTCGGGGTPNVCGQSSTPATGPDTFQGSLLIKGVNLR